MFSMNLEVIAIKSSVEINYLADKEEQSSDTDEFGDPRYDRLDRAPHGLYTDNQCPDNDLYA